MRSFQAATLIYDATVSFCQRFLSQRSRTVDQMVQAARSGRQNIAEGSRVSGTSTQTELRLVGVARASLDELLLDYEDFLRQRRLPQWPKDSREALAVRAIARTAAESDGSGGSDRSDGSDRLDRSDRSSSDRPPVRASAYQPWLAHADPGVVANALICLIHQTNFLLDQQIRELEREFIQDGGYTERLAAARIEHRSNPAQAARPIAPAASPTPAAHGGPAVSTARATTPAPVARAAHAELPAPTCPVCGRPMQRRTARSGAHAGEAFWGCTGYPGCKAIQPITG